MPLGGILRRAFARYRKQVIPEEAPTVQVQECRKAFYAGACIVLLELADRGGMTAAQHRLVQDVTDECDAFGVGLFRTDRPAVH